jgi:hypothetical protein
MLGFSRGGLETFHVVTHPGRIGLKAAMGWDSFLGTYGQYITAASQRAGLSEFEEWAATNEGRAPFIASKDAWLKANPEFNLDRVVTPFFWARNGIGPSTFGDLSNLIGAFMAARRPIQVVNFPLAQHNYFRPRERIEAMRLTVDWMDFWLNDREDNNPAKQDQYARWRKIRSEWQRQQAWETAGHVAGSVPDRNFKFSQEVKK